MLSASCVCPALRATAVRCKCGVDGLKQGGVIEWFGEEGHRARLQRLGSHGFIPVRRHKDNGNTGLARAQLLLQLQATAPWQPHIEEQTRRRVHLPRLEEGLRGGEGLGPPAHRAQETGEGVTDRLLIIDNRDQRGLGHAYLPGLVCVLLRPMPSSGKRTTRCGKAATIRWYRDLYSLVGGSASFSAMRTSSATEVARILRMTCPRCTLMVISLVPKSAAICLLRRPVTTSCITSWSRKGLVRSSTAPAFMACTVMGISP